MAQKHFFWKYVDDYRFINKSDLNLKSDFIVNLINLLAVEFGVKESKATSVANALYGCMSGNYALHYHTPLHIMFMLDFAERNNIKLEPWMELAIYFHDAIYDPKAMPPQNEWNSMAFMESLLGDDIPEKILEKASVAIFKTSKHLDAHITLNDIQTNYKNDDIILDLDLISFTFDKENYAKINENLEMELKPVFQEKYLSGRKDFLTKLMNRGFMFRTPELEEKFGKIALENLQLTIP